MRERGIVKLRSLDLPALRQAAYATGTTEPNDQVAAPQIEAVLRRALDDLGGGRLGACAALLFGLEPGTRSDRPSDLRREAAERWGVSAERFRRDPQELICGQLAESILNLAQRHQERLAHLDLEQRLPTASRLAVAWLERFEAYYRIWTPISGLGGDLTAYRSTLLDTDRPYDREPGTEGRDDPGYSQELQAAGYVSYALWHYTRFLVDLQRFISRYGGMWLLSDARAEEALENAVYRITWHNPNNEQDDSYLRLLWEQAQGELHGFRMLLRDDRIGAATEVEWQEWAGGCSCTWSVGDEVNREHFPTFRHHGGIDAACQVHAVITACNDYCTLVDDDWHRVADWVPNR
ncbi:MAG: hypothetical protein U5R31_13230 [Acidimicrobiia bacterium]|nr:hypothetical protein [Acidimicrobiia bacterium]